MNEAQEVQTSPNFGRAKHESVDEAQSSIRADLN